MIKTLTKLAQKPSDKNIRIVRIVFSLILILVITFGLGVTKVNFGLPNELKYGLYIFPLIGLIRGIFDPGVFRKKIWKWTIVGIGITFLLVSLFIIDDMPPITPAAINQTISGEIQIGTLQTTTPDTPFSLSTDNWFGFFGPILILMWLLLNGKNITKKNERYGEIVKKIRV